MQMLLFGWVLILNAQLNLLEAGDPRVLSLLNDQYPHAFFFRSSERAYHERTYPDYASWDRQFNRLQGIMGKCLDEECLERESRNPEFFNRFKAEHPHQAVLLHFNGNARDPRYQTDHYFPGHWIYETATAITQDVPAETGESTIHVADARRFRVNTGRYRTANDDLALFAMTEEGKHDWDSCEQVQLVAVDYPNNTIRVRRGCYGTKPRAFQAQRSRAAAHASEGPWGQTNHLMWFYNYSAQCPQDSEGKTCADRLVDDLAHWFSGAGPLASFDGLEFDVLFNETHGDTDGDGIEDNGMVDGVNQYGIGVYRFLQQLRERMGDHFLMLADGALGPGGQRSQRGWGLLNGIESEGWPNLQDWQFDDWSGGLNRHLYWRSHARLPALSYINHKWNESVPGKPGRHQSPDVPFSRHRLTLAAGQFVDTAITYSFSPPRDPEGLLGIWDELRCGAENRIGWLGAANGPPIRLAERSPNLLPIPIAQLESRFAGRIDKRITSNGLQISPADPDAADLDFTLKGVPTDGQDLFISLTMRGAPRRHYPDAMARFAKLTVTGGMFDLMAQAPIETGIKLRDHSREQPLDQDRGAYVRRTTFRIGEVQREAYAVHPPYQNGRGYTFWTQELDVPANAELRYFVGMGALSPERSDGVTFEVQVAQTSPESIDRFQRLASVNTNRHQWIHQVVSLAPFAGKRVRLKFVADCGPNDNSTTDHAYWADVHVVPKGATTKQITPTTSSMTWIGTDSFTSGFYFRDVRSPTVDLRWEVEGNDAIWVEAISAHAAPDAIVRIFEGGAVLANPALHPVQIPLSELAPGMSYQRLQATPKQAVDFNNGMPIGRTVTLPARDAIFLRHGD